MPDPAQQQEQMKAHLQRIKELKQLYQNVFESPDGKKVLQDLGRRAFMERTTLDDNPQKMAFKEGQRSMVLHIISMMELEIDKVQIMQKKQEVENDAVE